MEEKAFLIAIRDAPGDDVNRLVYADWLDENGKTERAAFIRAVAALRATKLGAPAMTSRAIDRHVAYRRLAAKEGQAWMNAWIDRCFPVYNETGQGHAMRCKSALMHESVDASLGLYAATQGRPHEEVVRRCLLGFGKSSIMEDVSAGHPYLRPPESYCSDPACVGFPKRTVRTVGNMQALIKQAQQGRFKDTPIFDLYEIEREGMRIISGHGRDRPPNHFKTLADKAQHIRALILSRCELQDFALKQLAASPLPELEYLEMGEGRGLMGKNNFTSKALIDFACNADMPHLRLLSLPAEYVTPEVEQAFRQAIKAFPALKAIEAGGRLIDVGQGAGRVKLQEFAQAYIDVRNKAAADRGWLDREGKRLAELQSRPDGVGF